MARAALEPALGPTGAPRACVVYYVQLGHWVKIGTSTDVQNRMVSYPPMARLLATEPGSYTLERRRLRQFNEYLVAGNEWFEAGPRLREHIASLTTKASCLTACANACQDLRG